MKLLRSLNGFTLVEVMIAGAIMTVVIFASAEFMAQMARSQARLALVQTAQDFKHRVVETLTSSASWLATLSDPGNTTFSCLTDGSDSCMALSTRKGIGEDSSRNFRIITSTGTVVFDSRDPSQGLSQRGSPCHSFPSSDCPLRLEVTWTAACPAAPIQAGVRCRPSEIEVEGHLVYNAGKSVTGATVINSSNYSFSMVKIIPPLAKGVAAPEVRQSVAFDFIPDLSGPVNQDTFKKFCDYIKTASPKNRATAVDALKLKMQESNMGSLGAMVDSMIQVCRINAPISDLNSRESLR